MRLKGEERLKVVLTRRYRRHSLSFEVQVLNSDSRLRGTSVVHWSWAGGWKRRLLKVRTRRRSVPRAECGFGSKGENILQVTRIRETRNTRMRESAQKNGKYAKT